jgi:hypothetical protein
MAMAMSERLPTDPRSVVPIGGDVMLELSPCGLKIRSIIRVLWSRSGTMDKYFLVMSSGYCGSYWLGSALDRHPDISCTCSKIVGLSIPHDSGFDISRHDPAIINEMMNRQGIASIDDMFDRVTARKPAKAGGDVHGWRISNYRENCAKLPHRPAALMHLIRHPAVLLERLSLEHVHRYKTHPRITTVMSGLFPEVCEQLQPILFGLDWKIEEDLRGLGFLFGLNDLLRVLHDVESSREIPLLTFENLMSSPAVFADLVHTLTGGSVVATADYLETIFAPDNLENSGRYRKTSVGRGSQPAEVFAKWSPQEQEAFRRVARTYSIAELYQSVPYDFSFID